MTIKVTVHADGHEASVSIFDNVPYPGKRRRSWKVPPGVVDVFEVFPGHRIMVEDLDHDRRERHHEHHEHHERHDAEVPSRPTNVVPYAQS